MSIWEQIVAVAMRPNILVLLVCGGRNYEDEAVFDYIMDGFLTALQMEAPGMQLIVVHGGAPGADRLADQWAKYHSIPVIAYHAEWEKHGRAAGMIRNSEMLKKWRPHLVVSFPGGRGTAHMVSIARKAGVHVHEVKV